MRFSGKVAVVTGAASGIGKATALRLAEEGATVVAGDIDAEGGEVLAGTSNGRIRFHRCDVTAEADIVALLAAAAALRRQALDESRGGSASSSSVERTSLAQRMRKFFGLD